MLDHQDLKEFLKLPPIFAQDVIKEIEKALVEARDCRQYVFRQLEYHGEDAFKNPDAYIDVGLDIKFIGLPKSFEDKFLAMLEIMRKENCV